MPFPSLTQLFKSKLEAPRITRSQLFFTGILAFAVSLTPRFAHTPFHRGFFVAVFFSGVFHLLLASFFNAMENAMSLTLALLSSVNVFLTAVVVHFTGGIVSPFIFAFFAIIVGEASYGIEYPIAPIAAALAYLGVVILESVGVLPPIAISPAILYANPASAVVVAVITTAFMVVTGQSYKMMMSALRTKIEKEQSKKQKVMRQLTRLDAPSQVGLLVNKIVHDVNGPLGAIAGFISMFQAKPDLSEETKADCEIMVQELERMSVLIKRLIHYTKPGRSTKELICPMELMNTVLSVASFHPGAKRIKFVKKFPEQTQIFVHANKEELQQVYFNLLKNSIEAMREEEPLQTISVGVVPKAKEVSIVIQDNGRGIPPGLLKKMSSEVISTKKEGGGVGLIIVKEILEAYGGRLEITSREGEWTQMLTTLPLHEEKTSALN